MTDLSLPTIEYATPAASKSPQRLIDFRCFPTERKNFVLLLARDAISSEEPARAIEIFSPGHARGYIADGKYIDVMES